VDVWSNLVQRLVDAVVKVVHIFIVQAGGSSGERREGVVIAAIMTSHASPRGSRRL
jgi:hypothetical protein